MIIGMTGLMLKLKILRIKISSKIKFVLLTGDITQSSEKSEVKIAYNRFTKRLKLPCIPTLGNHDLWPYRHEHICDSLCPAGEAEHSSDSIIEGAYIYGEVEGNEFEAFKKVYLDLMNYLPIPLF